MTTPTLTVGDRTFELIDDTARLVAADALDEADREAEAKLLRGLKAVDIVYGKVRDARFAYYEVCPRFSNEYTVYVVRLDYATRFKTAFPNAERVTRVAAIRRGITRVNEAKRDGEQWFGGLCEDQASFGLRWNATTRDRLIACANDTEAVAEAVLAEREAVRESRAAGY